MLIVSVIMMMIIKTLYTLLSCRNVIASQLLIYVIWFECFRKCWYLL